jgi:hypothetical protein
MTCLDRALGKLDHRSRALWERLADGTSLRKIALDWSVPYDRVRRWRTRMLQALRARLHGLQKNSDLQRRFLARPSNQ